MKTEELLFSLWKDYVKITPSALKIHQLLDGMGEKVINDHIALRTVNLPKVNIDVVAKAFIEVGYVEVDSYIIPEKKLFARHYENVVDPKQPKVFISELQLEWFSEYVQDVMSKVVTKIPQGLVDSRSIIFSGRTWGTISYETYQELRKESEYAAWLYVYGYCANHFTVNINNLSSIESVEEMNDLLLENQFEMNTSGGAIKGSKDVFLEQSSVLADLKEIEFSEGKFKIPSCYYEFARRYEKQGELFQGFVGGSANKIFESTNFVAQ